MLWHAANGRGEKVKTEKTGVDICKTIYVRPIENYYRMGYEIQYHTNDCNSSNTKNIVTHLT